MNCLYAAIHRLFQHHSQYLIRLLEHSFIILFLINKLVDYHYLENQILLNFYFVWRKSIFIILIILGY